MKFSSLQRPFKQYSLLEKGMSARTLQGILYNMKTLCTYAHTEEIEELTTTVIRSFLHNGRIEKGWSPKTFRNYWQYLKIFFDWCVKNQYLKKNPLEDIEKPKLDKRLPRCISEEDAKKILYHTAWYKWHYGKLEQSRNEAIIATMLMTGVRLQELLNLEVSDINLSSSNIFVRKGKNGKDRNIPIHPRLLPFLRGYFLEKQRYGKPALWFFSGLKSDKQLAQKDVRNICKKISIASGVKFSPHMLRHSFARQMVDRDFSLYKLKEIMGHSQITTTQIYLSVSTEGIRRSFEKVKMF